MNDLSLRIAALETIYELDLSSAQLTALRADAKGAADPRQRTAAKSTPKLAAAMKDLDAALAAQDSERITELRDQVSDLENDEAVELDKDVKATDAARAHAPAVLKMLKAGQLAAYLAEHADEVADPAEMLTDTLAEIRDPDVEDPDTEILQTAEEVGRLVAGLDAAKARQVTEQATAWLKAGRQLKDDEYAARQTALAEAARKIAGDLPPMTVLTHWMENELAELLANPQLTGAIDAVLAAKK
jgi:polyhydroxyalkanoate synthesis regulator phasin